MSIINGPERRRAKVKTYTVPARLAFVYFKNDVTGKRSLLVIENDEMRLMGYCSARHGYYSTVEYEPISLQTIQRAFAEYNKLKEQA